MNGRNQHSGYTLVELLVVMAIIVMMTALVVPTLISSGFFSSDKSRTGARDLFAQLRAANIHATTNNVNAAIAYDVEIPQDSIYDVDGDPLDTVPAAYVSFLAQVTGTYVYGGFDATRVVLTESILVRQLTIEELGERRGGLSLAHYIIAHDPIDEFGNYGDLEDGPPFVPVNNTFGEFQELLSDTCVLTNHPRMHVGTTPDEVLTNFQYETGLQNIAIFKIFEEENGFEVDRLLPKQADRDLTDADIPDRGLPNPVTWNNRFPAHVFKNTGGLDTSSGKQRIILPVGLKPDANYFDRYMVNENTDGLYTRDEFFGTGIDNPNELVGIETDVIIYAPTGRVKVADDDDT